MSTVALCKRINNFGYFLLSEGYALDFNYHTVEQAAAGIEKLSWSKPTAGFIGMPACTKDYLDLLSTKSFSLIMHDGGLIQLLYTFQAGTIKKHRLLYYPCPIVLEADALERFQDGLAEYVTDQLQYLSVEEITFRTPVRFDFEHGVFADYHPSSHITFNSAECRVPLKSALGFFSFAKFVLENFYPEAWGNPDLRSLVVPENYATCLSAHDLSRVHCSW